MTLYIKDMVCVRCKMAVQAVLDELRIDYLSIELGRVRLTAPLNSKQQELLKAGLKYYQLELMEDKKMILVEQVKAIIIEQLRKPDGISSLKLSALLGKTLNYNYTYLANLFSEAMGYTIERFYIESRVERAKELMVYEDLTLSEIAYRLNFSSVSHLSRQFKKVTGYSPAAFKKLCRSDNFIWRTC